MKRLCFILAGPVLLVVAFALVSSSQWQSCDRLAARNELVYAPLRHCQRSNRTAIGWENVRTVDKCAELAHQLKGMAFNFSPRGRRKKNAYENGTRSWKEDEVPEEIFYSCLVLDCPEYRNFSTMVNDTRYDYYSLYAFPPPFHNTTCLPQVGVFLYVDKRENYTAASTVCQTMGGTLAHIVSERRTNALSNLVADQYRTSFQPLAFVGLNETWATYNRSSLPQRNSGRGFITAAQEPIQCFWYRAWAPGHPRQLGAPRCVTITRTRSWRTVNCLAQLPFVCEINTSGPDMRVNVRAQCSTRRENNRKFWED